MTDFRSGYTSRWRLMSVDKDTWADIEEVPNVDSISVNRSCSSDAPLLEQGSMTVTKNLGEEFETGWYRLEMLASQGGSHERIYVATLLFEGYDGTTDFGVDTIEISGYSVLKPVEDSLLVVGDYISKGEDGAEWCAKVIRERVPPGVTVTVDGSFTVDDYYVFDSASSYLEAVWTVLDAAKWCMMIDGEGNIEIGPKPTEPALVLDRANASVLMPSIDYSLDVSNVPNRYYAVDGDNVATAVNDDADSWTSYTYRGWYKDEHDSSPLRVNGESLESYAQRKLDESRTLVRAYSYTREYWPGVVPFSLVTGRMTKTLEGDLRVIEQQLNCGTNGITVQEKAGIEVVV